MNLEKLLAAYRSKLPDIDTFMNEGANEEAISKLEKLCGHPLPELYKSILRKYDGEKKILMMMGGFAWLSVEQVLMEINRCNSMTGREMPMVDSLFQEQMIKKEAYLPERIPFANDGSGQYLCIDNVPDVKGKVGQIIYLPLGEPEPASVIANSFGEWIEWLTNAISTDRLALTDEREEMEEEEFYQPEIHFWARWKDDWTDVASEYNERNV